MKPKLILAFLLFTVMIYAQTSVPPQKSYKKLLVEYRKDYKTTLVAKDRAPLDEKGIKKMKFFKPNPSLNIAATFNRTPYAKSFDMLTYSGLSREYQQYGTIYFSIDGKEYSLAVYQNLELKGKEEYKDYLFLPFKDSTNDVSSYGGGRYINLSIKDINGNKIKLDFNKAYNPYCAYSDGYNCPIPPQTNHLNVAIEAGERVYKK